MVVVTTATASYLPLAAHMAYTARRHSVADRVVLCLLERDKTLHGLDQWFDDVFTPSDLLGAAADAFMFRHDACEAGCALKARTMLAALEHLDAAHVLWLDPDMWVFSGFAEVHDALRQAHVVLTPHVLFEECTVDSLGSDVFPILQSGAFNLGFIAVRRSAEARSVLCWWRDWVESWCSLDVSRGLFMDQRWMDLAVLSSLTAPLTVAGYNVNRANLRFRPIVRGGGAYETGRGPLRCVHFCGFGRTERPGALFDGASPCARALLRRYARRVRHFGWDRLRTAEWSYDRFASGEQIDPGLRRQVAMLRGRGLRIEDPFTLSNDRIARLVGRMS